VYYKNKKGYPALIKVPQDHVWLLGDNPFNSHDSRYYGPVPTQMLRGKIVRKLGWRPLYSGPVDENIVKSKSNEKKAKKVDAS
jgi:hypothetical protein